MSRSTSPIPSSLDAGPPSAPEVDAVRAAVDLWPAAVILLGAGPDLPVLASNRAGTLLLARGPVLSLEGGCLRFRRQQDRNAFVKARDKAAAEGTMQYLCLYSREGFPMIGLSMAPQPTQKSDPFSAKILVIACEFVDHVAPDPDPLAQMLGVTPAEGRIAVALASGLTIAGIAARDGASVHTVRDHVKHLLAKTGVNSQAQLVRMVVKLSQIAALPAERR